jgi:proline iminopeptidase
MASSDPPRASGYLPGTDRHEIWWEEHGSADGIPLVYLHGGPGGSLGAGGWKNKMDPARFRTIGLDQRGCGRSRPSAASADHDLASNTTAALIEDLEALRRHLGVERWVLNGVSWGTTLALAYAQAHPDRVLGVVLMAVTTTSRREVDWITEGVGAIFPEAWDALATAVEREDPTYRRGPDRIVEACAALLRGADDAARLRVARAWDAWESAHISLDAPRTALGPASGAAPSATGPAEDTARLLAFATLVTHYWARDGFLDPPLLERMGALEGIPAILVHGRRDVSGPVQTAWEVHRAWPGSELIIVEGEGHGGPAMVEHWRRANDRLADRLTAETST